MINIYKEEIKCKVDDNTKPSKMKNVLAELLEHIKTTPKEDLEREFEEISEWSNVGPTVEEFRTFCECVNKKPKYPTTYKECCERVNACPTVCISYDSNEDMLYNDGVDVILLALRKLRICRDTYWRIAGEEMGLDKPWKPDWNDSTPKYTIVVIGNDLVKHYTFAQNFILAFPTVEMRDTFYENFKDLIEECKDLL